MNSRKMMDAETEFQKMVFATEPGQARAIYGQYAEARKFLQEKVGKGDLTQDGAKTMVNNARKLLKNSYQSEFEAEFGLLPTKNEFLHFQLCPAV